MFEECDAVGNEDSSFGSKETLGSNHVVSKHVSDCLNPDDEERSHTKNVASHMGIDRGQDIIKEDPATVRQYTGTTMLQFTDSQVSSGIYRTCKCDASTLPTTQL